MDTEFVWRLRYALTTGPEMVEAVIDGGVARVYPLDENDEPQFDRDPIVLRREGRDWCRTEAEAIAVCEAMRAKRLAILTKQMQKVQRIDFHKLVKEQRTWMG